MRNKKNVPNRDRRQNITAHEYNPETEHLTVTFHDGRQYRYEGVPLAIGNAMRGAQSLGKFLHTHIIGKYDHTKIEP